MKIGTLDEATDWWGRVSGREYLPGRAIIDTGGGGGVDGDGEWREEESYIRLRVVMHRLVTMRI